MTCLLYRADSCVAAGSSNCCIDDGICVVPDYYLGRLCYCDTACYREDDCCYDIAQTCDIGKFYIKLYTVGLMYPLIIANLAQVSPSLPVDQLGVEKLSF